MCSAVRTYRQVPRMRRHNSDLFESPLENNPRPAEAPLPSSYSSSSALSSTDRTLRRMQLSCSPGRALYSPWDFGPKWLEFHPQFPARFHFARSKGRSVDGRTVETRGSSDFALGLIA